MRLDPYEMAVAVVGAIVVLLAVAVVVVWLVL